MSSFLFHRAKNCGWNPNGRWRLYTINQRQLWLLSLPFTNLNGFETFSSFCSPFLIFLSSLLQPCVINGDGFYFNNNFFWFSFFHFDAGSICSRFIIEVLLLQLEICLCDFPLPPTECREFKYVTPASHRNVGAGGNLKLCVKGNFEKCVDVKLVSQVKRTN